MSFRGSSSGSRRALGVAVLVTIALVVVGLLIFTREAEPTVQPPTTTTPVAPTPPQLSDLSTSLAVTREPFCETVDDGAIEAALGGPPTDLSTYDNGDRVKVGALSDISHEFGCEWQSTTGSTARAWVFVPPITVREAKAMIRDASAVPGCERLEGRYGAPSIGLTCAQKNRQQMSYRGLFGDTWLTCTLSAPARMAPGRIARRAERWCTSVALASAKTSPSGAL